MNLEQVRLRTIIELLVKDGFGHRGLTRADLEVHLSFEEISSDRAVGNPDNLDEDDSAGSVEAESHPEDLVVCVHQAERGLILRQVQHQVQHLLSLVYDEVLLQAVTVQVLSLLRPAAELALCGSVATPGLVVLQTSDVFRDLRATNVLTALRQYLQHLLERRVGLDGEPLGADQTRVQSKLTVKADDVTS